MNEIMAESGAKLYAVGWGICSYRRRWWVPHWLWRWHCKQRSERNKVGEKFKGNQPSLLFASRKRLA